MKAIDPLERFEARVQRTAGCWIWPGAPTKRGGYSQFNVNGRLVYVHRWAYEHFVAPIGDGLVLDHLCKNPRCVNPAHLEVVTRGENSRRGDHAKLRNERCPHGHPYDAENTVWRRSANGRPHRRCRTCARLHDRARYRVAWAVRELNEHAIRKGAA